MPTPVGSAQTRTTTHASSAFLPTSSGPNNTVQPVLPFTPHHPRSTTKSINVSLTPPVTPDERKVSRAHSKRVQGYHSRSASLSLMTSSTNPPSPTVDNIPIHSPRPSRGVNIQSHSRRPSIDGNRPPSRSEQLLRDTLNRDSARRPSLDRAETSPTTRSRVSNHESMAHSSRTPPRSATDVPHFVQPPLTTHEAQLRARLHGAFKRTETECNGIAILAQQRSAYHRPHPYPSPPSSISTHSGSDEAECHNDFSTSPSANRERTRRVPYTLHRSYSMPKRIVKSKEPVFDLALPISSPVRPASTQPHPCQPQFDPVSAAAQCSQMSGYVSFASVIPPPVGDDDDDDVTPSTSNPNSRNNPLSSFLNWWNR